MTEENKDEKKEESKSSEGSDEGVQQETISELDRADQIAERQKRENDRLAELLSRQEALKAREVIGGVTDAGQSSAEKKEESPHDYRVRVQKEMSEGKTEFGD